MTDLAHNDPPGLPPDIGRRVRSWSVGVARRAGVLAFYNARVKSVHFCLGDVMVGCAAFDVFKDGVVRLPTEDQACRTIYSGRMPRHIKDMRLNASHGAALDKQRAEMEADRDARRPDLLASAKKHFRGRKSFAVSGQGG